METSESHIKNEIETKEKNNNKKEEKKSLLFLGLLI